MSDSAPDGHVPASCLACNHDLRGCPSDRCPECGAPIYVEMVETGSAADAEAVAEPLRDAGLEVSVFTPATAPDMSAWTGISPVQRSVVRIRKADLAEAERLLLEHGLAPPVPIVDPADPLCPGCGRELPGADRARPGEELQECPACGRAFQWVDVGAADQFGGAPEVHGAPMPLGLGRHLPSMPVLSLAVFLGVIAAAIALRSGAGLFPTFPLVGLTGMGAVLTGFSVFAVALAIGTVVTRKR